jgi:ABC-2 type transport system permease protein
LATSELPSTALLGGNRAAQPRGILRYRELLRELIRRDLQSRHRGSALGNLWSLLNPLLYMLVFTAVFSHFGRFNVGAPYPVFLMSSMLAWNFFNQGVIYAMRSVTDNGTLVKKVAFPWLLLTLSAVVAAFVNYLISLVLLIPLVLLFHVPLDAPLLLAPILAILTFALSLGLGMLVATGNVFFRDVEHILTIVLQAWFFLTPIIYPLCVPHGDCPASTKPDTGFHLFRFVVDINPMTWVAVSFQDVIAFHRWPPADHLVGLAYATGVALLLLGTGIFVFMRAKARFAEEL